MANRPPVPARRPLAASAPAPEPPQRTKSDVKIFTNEELSSMRSKREDGLSRNNLSFVCLDHSEFLEQLKLEEQAEKEAGDEIDTDNEDTQPRSESPKPPERPEPPNKPSNLPARGNLRGTPPRSGSPNRGAPRGPPRAGLRGAASQGSIPRENQTPPMRGGRGSPAPGGPGNAAAPGPRGRGRGRGGRGRGRGGPPGGAPPPTPQRDSSPKPMTPSPDTNQPSSSSLTKSGNEFSATPTQVRHPSPKPVEIKLEIKKPLSIPLPPPGYDYVASIGYFLPTQEARKHLPKTAKEEPQPQQQRRSVKLSSLPGVSNAGPTTRVKSLKVSNTDKTKSSGPKRGSVQIAVGPCKPLEELIKNEKIFVNDMQSVVVDVRYFIKKSFFFFSLKFISHINYYL